MSVGGGKYVIWYMYYLHFIWTITYAYPTNYDTLWNVLNYSITYIIFCVFACVLSSSNGLQTSFHNEHIQKVFLLCVIACVLATARVLRSLSHISHIYV